METLENAKLNESCNPDSTEFYKYAYTKLLKRHVSNSCDRVIASGEILQHNLDYLLRDLQEMINNCTREERDAMMHELSQPQYAVIECAKQLSETLRCLGIFKLEFMAKDIG